MKDRLESLNFVRTLAFLGVLSYHMNLTMAGAWSVTVFFVLSGFLLTYNYFDRPMEDPPTLKGGLRFSMGKIKKLYPLHLLSLAVPLSISLFGILTHRAIADKFYLARVLANALLLQSLVPDQEWYFAFNAQSWYLSATMFIYICFPFILRRVKKLRSRRHALAVLIGLVLFQGCAVKILTGFITKQYFSGWLGYIFPGTRAVDFSVGCCAAYLFINRGERKLSPGLATVTELMVLAVNVGVELLYKNNCIPKYLRNSTAYIIPAVLLVYVFALAEGYISRLTANKVTAFLARHSSNMYLIHAAVIQLASIALERVPQDFSVKKYIFLAAVPSMSIIASVLWQKTEQGIRNRKKA